jgi:hypothetical protein
VTASLYVLDRGWVAELAELAGPAKRRGGIWPTRPVVGVSPSAAFLNVLAEHARRVQPGYEWSGYCMLALVDYLQRHGARLRNSDLNAELSAINRVHSETILLTATHKKYLDKLAPTAHREDRIRAYFAKQRLDFEEAGVAGLDGLELLHDALTELQPNEVLLLHVG